MIYIISNESGLRREINKIKNIRVEAYKKTIVSSNEDWDYDYSLASGSSWDKHRQSAGRKDINKLDHVVTENLKNYNNQSNEAIDN